MSQVMDVILLKDVEQLGAAGSTVHVKAGFARNYLIPHGLAAPATPQRLRAIEAVAQQRAQKVQRVLADVEALKRRIEGKPLTLKLTLGMDDKPFGAITAHDVFEALCAEHQGAAIEKHAVHLEQPIKALGIVEVPVRLHPQVTATLKVWVVKA